MLKLIRKYQLVILAIGGSLMMVVFLLEPIISRLAPDSRKKAVAQLASGASFDGFDEQRADWDLALLKSVYPRAFQPISNGGFGLRDGGQDTAMHWLLLTKQALDADIVGDDAEGRDWLDIIAEQEAAAVVQQELQQGLYTTPDQYAERFESLLVQVRSAMQRNVGIALSRSRGMTEDEVYRTLAKARAVQRLYQLYTSVPSYSDVGSLQAAKERFDAVAVESVVIPGSAMGDTVAAPSDEELGAFFEEYKGEDPRENAFGIGYLQPSRIKLGWIELNASVISESIEPDRVEMRKMWTRDREKPEGQRQYPGDFAGERANIESAYKEQLTQEIMIEADRVIRARVLQSTSALSKEGGFFVLPEDWASERPSLDSIAQEVVEGVREALGVTVPTPGVQLATDRWYDPLGVSGLEGFGFSTFRIGSSEIQAFRLPLVFEEEAAQEMLGIQVGVPQIDPPATDALGNRYYPIVYEALEQGAALSIDDAGYDRVLEDYRSLRGFESLTARLEELQSEAASEGGVEGVVELLLGTGDDVTVTPNTVFVRRSGVGAAPGGRTPNRALNADVFIDAVLSETESLDPLMTPEQADENPVSVAVAIDRQRSVAVARVVAPRPITIEAYRAQFARMMQAQRQLELQEALSETELDPFSFEALKERYGFEMLRKRATDSVDGEA